MSSIVWDVATESVYIVNATVPNWRPMPNANNDAVNYSRIFIDFPTYVGSNPVFLPNLGGYKGILNERVGCAFTANAPNIVALAGKTL